MVLNGRDNMKTTNKDLPSNLRVLAKKLDNSDPDAAKLLRESAIEIEKLRIKLS